MNEQTEANGFSGTWMLVVTWDAVRPYSGNNEFITDEVHNIDLIQTFNNIFVYKRV